jgi:hypothetical protein
LPAYWPMKIDGKPMGAPLLSGTDALWGLCTVKDRPA